MSTTALSGLRDYLCGSLSLANMLWLSQQLAEYVQQKQIEEDESPLPRQRNNYLRKTCNFSLQSKPCD